MKVDGKEYVSGCGLFYSAALCRTLYGGKFKKNYMSFIP
jgi:hypothetical protein